MPAKSISVALVVNSPDQLRKIDLRLSRESRNEGEVEWTMEFTLNERKRKSDPFVEIIRLSVKVNAADNRKAEVTAQEGLDKRQTEAAFAAADSAKALSEGRIPKAKAEADTRQVITARKF